MKVSDLNVPIAELAGDDRAVRFVRLTSDQALRILGDFQSHFHGDNSSAVAIVAMSPKDASASRGRVGTILGSQSFPQHLLFKPVEGTTDTQIIALMIGPTGAELD